jgi:molybdenum cofactor synthesis domain-containing protein
MDQVEIIAIGNEILRGEVQDTNTHWLCRQITGLGGQVRQAALVRDDQAVIVDQLRQALARQSALIFTTGGLGPTDDDLTLPAVAVATQRDLVLNAEALAQVTAKYERLAQEGSVETAAMTPARQKMAYLPAGATPLANPVGAAPGVLLKIKPCTIVSLPGVPAELKGIFEETLPATLTEILGTGAYLQQVIIVDCGDESVLAPILSHVSNRRPQVYLKSHASAFGPEVKFRVTLSASGTSKSGVQESLAAARQDLEQGLNKAGISIEG